MLDNSRRLLFGCIVLVLQRFSFASNNTTEGGNWFDYVVITRTTNYGLIAGKLLQVDETEAEVFLGVPYAAPPVGELRFEYPVPPKPWNNTLECLRFKSTCLQSYRYFDHQNEDCLYLNIIAPPSPNAPGNRYPVLVWIHGGSLVGGTANDFPLDTTVTNLVASNIIVVYVNYRLNILGFLSLGNNSLPGNYGLEDQLLALKWVHQNIHHFNGDPNRITLTGESAGAVSASLLALSKKSRGLAKQLMLQSGSSLIPWANLEKITSTTEKVIQTLKCSISENASELLSCLRNVNGRKFIDILDEFDEDAFVNKRVTHDSTEYHWTILSQFSVPRVAQVVDDYRMENSLLEDTTENLLKHNSNMTIFIGTTNLEMLGMVHMQCFIWWEIMTEKKFKTKQSIGNFSLDIDYQFPFGLTNGSQKIDWDTIFAPLVFNNPTLVHQAIEKVYNVPSDLNKTELLKRIAKIYSDYIFIGPAVAEASYYANNNNTVYFYYYMEENNPAVLPDAHFPFNMSEICDVAAHGHDLARLFQSDSFGVGFPINEEWKTGNIPLTKFLSKMITNFVKTGDPNSDNSLTDINWRRFTKENKAALLIHPTNPKMIDMVAESNYNFWYNIFPIIEKLKC